MATATQIIYIDLGFIGNTAEKLQNLFPNHTSEPNENGFYLKFENYSHLVVNTGVSVETNCFESEEEFKEDLFSKLLFSLDK